MPCACLDDLPPVPEGKTGWPWTEESAPCTDASSVSIVIPSFQQAAFLESAIRSVLLQGIPNLELRVMDGGSTDGSREIIERYAPWIDHWQSAADGGQGAAINEGLRDSDGEVLGWLCSDDLLLPNGIARLLRLRNESPQSAVWIGASEVRDAEDKRVKVREPVLGTPEAFGRWFVDAGFHQPGALFSRDLFQELDGLREDLQCFLDVEFWIRARKRVEFSSCTDSVAMARVYPDAKSLRLAKRQLVEWVVCTWELGMPDVAEWKVTRSLERASEPERVLSSMKSKDIVIYLIRRLFRRSS